jgi:hypothetical protein
MMFFSSLFLWRGNRAGFPPMAPPLGATATRSRRGAGSALSRRQVPPVVRIFRLCVMVHTRDSGLPSNFTVWLRPANERSRAIACDIWPRIVEL